jgi:poly(3-hydroxybutyrate) depolymerase
MSAPVTRRTFLATGAAAAGALVPGAAAFAGWHPGVRFTLNAEVLDGGEQVISITLHTARLGPIDPRSLTTGSFRVHAKATSPIPIAPGDQIFSEYDLDRPVTAARLDRRGDIVLELASGEGVLGGGTLGYIAGKGRNVVLDLTYTVTQVAPLALRHGRPLTIARFVPGELSDPEVDAFSSHVSRAGMKYRLYAPGRGGGRGGRALIVWLHGGGEGGLLPDGYYDNETTLRANRGALGFATDQAQRIFGGAYVVAPQCFSYWLEDGPRFAPLVRQIIDDLVRRHRIDRERIYVAGCSNGGYMTMEMTSVYPDLFAAAVPICGVVASLEPGGPPVLTDAQLQAIDTPTWLVASRDDTTVPIEANTVHAQALIPGAVMTLYDHVIWNGHQFPGHWSWIYVARNDPAIDGTHIWEWMAAAVAARARVAA